MRHLLIPFAALGLSLPGCSGADEGEAAVTEASPGAETRRLAEAFLTRYLIEGDVLGAYAEHAQPDFVQHSPNFGDGVAAHRAYFEGLMEGGANPADWAHVSDMLLVDGDLFALVHHVFRDEADEGRIFVDIWRVEDGRIAEHWDVQQAMVADMPHGNGMGCGSVETYALASVHEDSITNPTCGRPDPAASRADTMAVYEAYVAQVEQGEVIPAIERWFHPDYRQHSPVIADGKQGAIDYLRAEWGGEDAPLPELGPMRVVAEGDLALFHYMYRLEGQPDEAHIDIFRVTDGLISEHWDYKQPVPERMAHDNGMW